MKKSNPFPKLNNLILKTRKNKKTSLKDLKEFFLIMLKAFDYYRFRYLIITTIVIGALFPIFGKIMGKAMGGMADEPNIPLFLAGFFGLFLSFFLILKLVKKLIN